MAKISDGRRKPMNSVLELTHTEVTVNIKLGSISAKTETSDKEEIRLISSN